MHKNNENKFHKLIIIGSGPAGYTAAIYAARANLQPILITGLQKGGQLINTNQIENWPGRFKKTTGIELMNDMEKHVKILNTKIVHDQVIKVDFSNKILVVFCEFHKYYSHTVIIATGSSPKYLNLKSEKKFLGKGISTCATCDGFFYKNHDVAVVGGGNTAIEEVLYLSNIASQVHLIHRRKQFTAEKILIEKLKNKINLGKVVLHLDYVVSNIIGKKLEINSIEITHTKNYTENKKIVFVKALFIAIGSMPNTKIFKNILNMKNGYIQIQKKYNGFNTQTNIPNVFAAGDVTDNIYKQAITSAGSGCMAALDAEKYLNSLNIINI
ncbi:thioredoxin-disulfide reductase [Buchnera aphidicola]|uniref:thioredoxin-disulfide reductase n=1 Tax=Buchnera aphidicola TaxID=9 RepID=UPI0031B8A498